MRDCKDSKYIFEGRVDGGLLMNFTSVKEEETKDNYWL